MINHDTAACHQKRKKCDIVRPCRRCVKYGVECVERSAHPSKRRKVESIITSRLCSVHGCMVGDMNGVKGPTVGRHNNGLPSLVSDISMETSSYSLPPSPASTATSARDASPISISDVAPSPGLPATPTTDSGQGRSERDIYASLAGIYSQEDGIVRAFYGSGYGVNNQEIGGHEMSEAVASALLDDILRELPGPSAEAPRLEIRNTKFMRVPIYGIQGNAEAETELFKMLEEDCDVMMPMNTAEREQTTGQTFDFMQIENLLDTDYAADTIQNNTISGFDDSVSQPNLDFSYYSNPVPDMEESGHNAIVDFTAADDFMACIDFGMGGDLSCLEFPEDWRFGSDDLVLAPVSTLSSNTNDNIGPS